MKHLKKNAIGYNTVSSENGVINARGVKSYPNNLEIFGYTHEVGEGEKSPDNPYTLISLDSGNVNLYSEDKIRQNTVGKFTSTGKKVYGIELPHPRSGYYCVRANPSTEYPLTYNFYNIETNELAERNWNIAINNNNSDKGKIIKVGDGLGLLLYDCRDGSKGSFTNRTNFMILDSPIMPSKYVTDEHSVLLSNNDMSIKVPVPFPLNSVDDVRDYLFKDTDNLCKVVQNTATIDSYNAEDISTPYISSVGELSVGAKVIYQLEKPIEHVLSDYAQQLLNSLTLQIQNEIWVEGYPDIKVSGYIQK